MRRSLCSSLEVLEARIAPAGLTVFHPLLDMVPALGKTGTSIDLSTMFDASDSVSYRTHVEFTTNFDVNPTKAGIQGGKIVIELFDDKAPLTVANFLSYVESTKARGDYDGVYFHRLVSGFVLQTGGYENTGIGKHIPVGEAVPNEFDPTDTERANTAGTLAMAKIGDDPNSATSEFFFNLADNRENLDNQNGGFTVFGKVVQGMDVVNAIASLPTLTINGSPTPYHNGYKVDPDNNPNTPPPVPKPSQVVAFTDVKVVPQNSTKLGVNYSVEVTDVNGVPTDLVKTNANAAGLLKNDTLNLTYKPGGSGIAVVKVTATDALDPLSTVTEEFEVDLRPNLSVQISQETLPLALVGGDTGKVTVKLRNTSAGQANGLVDVQFYLSRLVPADSSNPTAPSDPTGNVLGDDDILVGSVLGTSVNIAPGKSQDLTADITINPDLEFDTDSYRLIAKVTPSEGSAISELYPTSDNQSYNGRVYGLFDSTARPNLTALGMVENLPTLIVPGDKGLARLGITNTASTVVSGAVTVSFYLSYDANPGQNSADTFNPTEDFLIGSTTQSLQIALNEQRTVEAELTIPPNLQMTDGYYRIFGVISTPEGSSVVELSTSDNIVASNYHRLQKAFGTFTINDPSLGVLSRKNVVFNYEDGQGNDLSLKITGPGYGLVVPTAENFTLFIDGTNLKSKFSVGAPEGIRPIIQNVAIGTQSGAPIGTLDLSNVDFSGNVTMIGGARTVLLGNTTGTGDHFVGIGVSPATAKIRPVVTMGNVQDLSFEALTTIGTLQAQTWTDSNVNVESVSAYGLINFRVTGDFEADMNVSSPNPAKTPAMKTFNVGGVLSEAQVKIAGNVGSVNLGGITGSNFLVGASVVPGALQDFNFARTIASVVVNGTADSDFVFEDSRIAAAKMTKVVVRGTIEPSSDVSNSGFIADRIATYVRGISPALKNLNDGDYDVTGDYRVRLLS